MDDRIPYDIEDARMTNMCLGAILRAVVMTGAKITDSFMLPGGYKNPNMNPVSFKVWVPKGKKAEFEVISNVKLRTPPRVEGM